MRLAWTKVAFKINRDRAARWLDERTAIATGAPSPESTEKRAVISLRVSAGRAKSRTAQQRGN